VEQRRSAALRRGFFGPFGPRNLHSEPTDLSLHEVYVESLPEALGSMRSLERLSINNFPKLVSLPASLSQLPRLKILWLREVRWSQLPDTMRGLRHLEELFVARTQLRSLPLWLGELTSLRVLEMNGACSYASDFVLPDSMRRLVNLTELSLKCTRLIELPSWLGELTSLEVLSVADNYLRALPDVFDALPRLNHVFVRRNRLQELPESLLRWWRSRVPSDHSSLGAERNDFSIMSVLRYVSLGVLNVVSE
jgi:Leucine-rich repeat (LRR) protein